MVAVVQFHVRRLGAMRQIALIVGQVLMAALTAVDLYQFLVADDGVGYFAARPRRLLFVGVIALVGGLFAFMLSRCSPLARRTLRLTALGGFAACITLCLALFAARLAPFASMVTEAGMWGWVIAALGSLLVVAVLVWLEFYRVWRQHEDVV